MVLSTSLGALISLLFTTLVYASGPTSIFINQVPAYQLLSSCAEAEVSTIVRDMYYGCGDGSKTTSYACFCLQSSVAFSSMISKHVSSNCENNTDQISTAAEVFSSYCALGSVAAQTSSESVPSSAMSTSMSSSSSAAPASTPALVTVTATPSSTTRASSSNTSHTAAIAAGVAVPLGVTALASAAFFFWRRRKQRRSPAPSELAAIESQVHETSAAPEIRELKEDPMPPPPIELDSGERRSELDTPTREKFGPHGPVEMESPPVREKPGFHEDEQ